MMATVTSSRRTPEQDFIPYHRNGVRYDLFWDARTWTQKPSNAVQTTTSFRTGKSSDGEPEHRLPESGTNWAQASRSVTRDPWSSKGTKYDTGHPFHTTKSFYSGFSHPEWNTFSTAWSGPLMPRVWGTGLQGLYNYSHVPSQPSLVVQGVSGIRSTLPTVSPAALAQALIELKREGLPKIKQTILDLSSKKGRTVAKGVGSSHLGVEFGIKPLLRDLNDAINVVLRGDEILKKFEDGVGKRQHRQRIWEPRVYAHRQEFSASSGMTYAANFHGVNAATMGLKYSYGSHVTTDRTVEIIDKFTGAYIYYLPKSQKASEIAEFARKYRYLTGLDISASLLWELTPWSWLADWVFNFGDSIAVAESLRDDGLVLVYGYMMRETRYRATRTLYGLVSSNGTSLAPVTVTYNTVTKERIRATPYGFGLSTTGFTARQWAVLGALGLTKGSNALHRT